MIIIVGLGNPGEEFKKTRHNVGFDALDIFAREHQFPDFAFEKKSNALVSEQMIDDQKILLVKPQTFMNESGSSVRSVIKNTSTDNIIVIHDDIDLPVGSIKIVKERGSAGHKGVESIIQNIGNEGLIRIRIGIKGKSEAKAKEIVLKKFTLEEDHLIKESLAKTTQALYMLIKDGLEKSMNEHN